jgi:hypothetical protein
MRAKLFGPVLAALFLAAAASGCAPRSADCTIGADVLFVDGFSDGLFADQGPFVEIPAQVGFVVVGAGGMVLTAWQGYQGPGEVPFVVCGTVGYLAVGGSCWVVKVVVWDLPRSLIRQARPPAQPAR